MPEEKEVIDNSAVAFEREKGLIIMGLDDPQWGKRKGNAGPPDLDDVIRNFSKKINSILVKMAGIMIMKSLVVEVLKTTRR